MSSLNTYALRAAALLAVLFAALALPACTDACEHLASQICYCLPDDGTRATCNTQASQNEDVFSVSGDDNAYCQHLLDTNACDCNVLTTPQGKANCGLSYNPYPDGGTLDAGQ